MDSGPNAVGDMNSSKHELKTKAASVWTWQNECASSVAGIQALDSNYVAVWLRLDFMWSWLAEVLNAGNPLWTNYRPNLEILWR